MINLWLTLSYDNGFNNWHTSTILSVATNPRNYKRIYEYDKPLAFIVL